MAGREGEKADGVEQGLSPSGCWKPHVALWPDAASELAVSDHLDWLPIRTLTLKGSGANVARRGSRLAGTGAKACMDMFGWLADKRRIRQIGRWFGWVALGLVLLTILTGYGITQFRVVDPLTAGLLGKAVSQRWHEYVGLLVLLFLTLHVGIALWWRWKGARD